MEISRRSLLAASAVAAAVPLAVAAAGPAAAGDVAASRRSLAHRQFVRLAQMHGAKQLAAEPMVNQHDEIGGLNYTANFGHPDLGPQRYVIQPSARVEDIAKRAGTAVLPMFTIGGLMPATDALAQPRMSLVIALQYLMSLGIPLDSLSFATSELSPEMVEVVRALGVDPGRLTVRDGAEAKAAGDGSGWFTDKTTDFATRTMSIAATRDDKTAELMEVADIGLVAGLERVEWARTGKIDSWAKALPGLLATIRRDAEAAGLPLPVGYEKFAASA